MVTHEKVKHLQVGEKYKYKTLCRHFGESEVRGKGRGLQLARWKKYFQWHTEGKTQACYFIIDKIYAPIRTLYEVEGVLFDTLQEAEEYRKSL